MTPLLIFQLKRTLNMMKFAALILICFCLANINILSQWTSVSPPGNDTAFYCVNVVNPNVVYAGKGSHGIIIKSTNGGINWVELNTPASQLVYKIQFLNETTGFIAAGSGLYKTNTGGASWQTLSTGSFCDLHFVSESTGYGINADFPAKVYRTTNGGANFSVFNMGSYPSYLGQALSFVNANTIFALTVKPASDSSIIFKCTNWDSGWVPVLKTKPACYDISFADANTGIACGNLGTFRKTTDGGVTWQSLTPTGSITVLACTMNSLITGYLVCSNGSVFKTSNSGSNWFPQISGTTSGLNEIDVLNSDNTGFIAGDNGTILKTTNGGVTFLDPNNNTAPAYYSLEQNYPNPFNPVTAIRFSLPVSGNVTLKVFDITGRLVSEIVNGNLQAGLHEVSFDASDLSSGAYFCKLETKSFSDIKTMILVK